MRCQEVGWRRELLLPSMVLKAYEHGYSSIKPSDLQTPDWECESSVGDGAEQLVRAAGSFKWRLIIE